jgi:hypothetical protein
MKRDKSYQLQFLDRDATDLIVYLIHTYASPHTIDHPPLWISVPIYESVLNTPPQD